MNFFRLGWWHDEIMQAARISPELGLRARERACQQIADITRQVVVERLFGNSGQVYFPSEHGGG